MHRRTIIRAGLAFITLAGLALGFDHWVGFPRPIPEPDFTGRLAVLSYNVQADRSPTSDTERVIREAGADVVCVQEASPAWHRFLKRRLRDQYPASLFRDHGNGFGGLAFYSRYALREIRYLSPSESAWFPAWIVEAKTPAGPVQIANVHLRPLIAGVGGKAVGYFTVPRVHRREIDSVLSAMTPGRPALIVGDFNGDEDDPGVLQGRDAGFGDVLEAFDSGSPTWQGRVWKLPVSARADHILCSRHFRAESARVLRPGGSDHCPVLGEMALTQIPTSQSSD